MTEGLRSVVDGHEWWSVDQAAQHMGFSRATVERYIREGLPQTCGFVNRDAFLAMVRQKQLRQKQSRGK